MSVAGTVLSFLHVLIWPALVCALAVMFRSTIRRLLQVRLMQLDAGGISVKFNTAAMEAEEVVEADKPPQQGIRIRPDPGKFVTMSPRDYYGIRQVGETFRDGKAVLLDLTETADYDAKRMIDFAAGLIFADHGSIDRVSPRKYALIPGSTLHD